MKKFLILLVVIVLLASSVFAATIAQTNTADAMNELGLFQGMGGGDYALDNGLTRAQGTTLLVRMIGKEAEANSNTYTTPFTDVDAWAAGYIGYAYANGITNGVSATAFGSNQPMTDYMFLTLTLRALGYSDSGADALYTWNNPYALAYDLGLITVAAADAAFTRADAVTVFWNALDVNLNGMDDTLADRLVSQGIFTAEKLAEARQTQKNGRGHIPTDPIQQEQPGAPIVPSNPSAPSNPSVPSTPSKPSTPSTPSTPGTPSTPSNPGNGSVNPTPGENGTPIG